MKIENTRKKESVSEEIPKSNPNSPYVSSLGNLVALRVINLT
jgi:hypothetical protein